MDAVTEETEVLKIDEVAAFLRVDPKLVEAEIDAGKLKAISIGGETRIIRKDLDEFLEHAARSRSAGPRSGQRSASSNSRGVIFKFPLRAAKAFEFRWPDNSKEIYKDTHVAVVQQGSSSVSVTVGFAKRFAAGKERERGLVLVAGRPLVEFVGADDFDESRLMVSVIKHPMSNAHVSSIDDVPLAYSHLRIEPYKNHVTGPYAYSSLAVVCRRDDLKTMVEHAMIRFRELQNRKKHAS